MNEKPVLSSLQDLQKRLENNQHEKKVCQPQINKILSKYIVALMEFLLSSNFWGRYRFSIAK